MIHISWGCDALKTIATHYSISPLLDGTNYSLVNQLHFVEPNSHNRRGKYISWDYKLCCKEVCIVCEDREVCLNTSAVDGSPMYKYFLISAKLSSDIIVKSIKAVTGRLVERTCAIRWRLKKWWTAQGRRIPFQAAA